MIELIAFLLSLILEYGYLTQVIVDKSALSGGAFGDIDKQGEDVGEVTGIEVRDKRKNRDQWG